MPGFAKVDNMIDQVLARYTTKYKNRQTVISTFEINKAISLIILLLYRNSNINTWTIKKLNETQKVVPALTLPLPNNPNCTNDAII